MSASIRCGGSGQPVEESIDGGPWKPVNDPDWYGGGHGFFFAPEWSVLLGGISVMCFGTAAVMEGYMPGLVGIVGGFIIMCMGLLA